MQEIKIGLCATGLSTDTNPFIFYHNASTALFLIRIRCMHYFLTRIRRVLYAIRAG